MDRWSVALNRGDLLPVAPAATASNLQWIILMTREKPLRSILVDPCVRRYAAI